MRSQARLVAAVAVGGALGSAARYGVGLAVPHPPGTLAVNASGCLLIGLLVARHRHDALLRALLGTGLLGGWTTFSTASTDAVGLAQGGAPLLATAYVAGTLALAVAATATGLALGRPRDGSVR
jgi:fluoride exporter